MAAIIYPARSILYQIPGWSNILGIVSEKLLFQPFTKVFTDFNTDDECKYYINIINDILSHNSNIWFEYSELIEELKLAHKGYDNSSAGEHKDRDLVINATSQTEYSVTSQYDCFVDGFPKESILNNGDIVQFDNERDHCGFYCLRVPKGFYKELKNIYLKKLENWKNLHYQDIGKFKINNTDEKQTEIILVGIPYEYNIPEVISVSAPVNYYSPTAPHTIFIRRRFRWSNLHPNSELSAPLMKESNGVLGKLEANEDYVVDCYEIYPFSMERVDAEKFLDCCKISEHDRLTHKYIWSEFIWFDIFYRLYP
jgi:hypothetical protein